MLTLTLTFKQMSYAFGFFDCRRLRKRLIDCANFYLEKLYKIVAKREKSFLSMTSYRYLVIIVLACFGLLYISWYHVLLYQVFLYYW